MYKKKLIIEDNSQDNIQLSDINDISILDTLFVDSINNKTIKFFSTNR